MSQHIRPADAEQYVLGALEPEAAAALEAHTLDCPPCASILQREALLEEQLREVAQAPAPEPRVIRPARWHRARLAAAAGVMVAAAAAVSFLVLRPERTVPTPSQDEDFPVMALPMDLPSTPERLVACPDLASQEACASEALARGLLVQYPQGVGEVPRYEGHAGLPKGALDAEGPYSL
ncbi:zf-HC2 domain-containing protein [Archangium violaceum]|uniref:zf-HC2 domain-containing protein n=1 Tax=Archangium violaceum TaxID=83451 RepID=UPI0019519511|nr:zf-HC2 domain-containing protein [Archangium violaceum]QRN95131.1 zf-HC2 domain-containing protein [Archangium violaceum]